MIEFLNANKKNKNLIINIDIIFLGIYINKTSIINKWAIKYVNIETIKVNPFNFFEKDLKFIEKTKFIQTVKDSFNFQFLKESYTKNLLSFSYKTFLIYKFLIYK